MRYWLQVASSALPGREADYETWYKDIHMWEVMTLPGFLSCQRFCRVMPGAEGGGEYVAVYEVETDDPGRTLEALMAAGPKMRMTDAIDLKSVRFEFLKPLGDRQQRKG